MKYQANPVIVDAFKIVSVGHTNANDPQVEWDGKYNLALDNGENVTTDHGMTARYAPQQGDYWVIQSDGYIYLNPKDVFERKYSPLPEQQAA